MRTPRVRSFRNLFETVGKSSNLKFRIYVGKRFCVLFMRAAKQGINSITTRVRFWILIDDLGKQLFPLALHRRIAQIYSKYRRHLSNPQHCCVPPATRKANTLYGFYNTYDTLWAFSRKTIFWTDIVDGLNVEKFAIFDTAIAYRDLLHERQPTVAASCVFVRNSLQFDDNL